jgi:hypothetical protein
MSGPLGIPDLTALVGDPGLLQARLALDVPPLVNRIDAAIAGAIPAGASRCLPTIASLLGWPVSTVERRIPGLVRSGALSMSVTGSVSRAAVIRPLGRLYAIETKIRGRVAAIQQARTYAVWADSYVLVMGELGPRSTTQLIADVSDDQGGLMIGGEWIRRPVLSPLDEGRRLWASEHLVAAVSGASEPALGAPVEVWE